MSNTSYLPEVTITGASSRRAAGHISIEGIGDMSSGHTEATMMTLLANAVSNVGAQHCNQDDDKYFKPFGLASSLLACLPGKHLIAVSKPVNDQTETTIWRTSLYRSDDLNDVSPQSHVAEYTHTYALTTKPTPVAPEEVSPAPEEAATEGKPKNGTLEVAAIGQNQDKLTTTADKRRMQIFHGACKVIAEKGYGEASIRDIAKAAKISIPSMYQYIENKEDILYLITSTCMEEIFQFFRENVDTEKEPVTALTEAIFAYFKYININRRYINLVYSETRALGPENREKVFQIEKKFMRLWENILEKGQKEGVFAVENTDLYANFIYFFCTVWSLRYWSIGQHGEEIVRNEITTMIINGILTEKR